MVAIYVRYIHVCDRQVVFQPNSKNAMAESRLFSGTEESYIGTSLPTWDANGPKQPPLNYLTMKDASSETQVR